MTDNSILARAKALVDGPDENADAWLAKAGPLLRDIIAALEGQPNDDHAKARNLLAVIWRDGAGDKRDRLQAGPLEPDEAHFIRDLIEHQRLQLAEAERKLREADEEIKRLKRCHAKELRDAEQSAASEERWKHTQGDDYGSY